MKFDAIIIGGGHSGLERGMQLLSGGKSCLAIARGESSRSLRDETYDYRAACREFRRLGGELFFGDSVATGEFSSDGRLLSVSTRNHGSSTRFEADEFFLATGSFFSGGLAADMTHIYEPIFGLDVDCAPCRGDWLSPDFFGLQPFMKFGVRLDASGCALRGGAPAANLYPIGSIVSKL